ncbi:MAG: hypothetical protein IKP66_01325 [Lachnospiraceae bacterium]|nr:hypothetical protein [Lachnospiraceae bacterium]
MAKVHCAYNYNCTHKTVNGMCDSSTCMVFAEEFAKHKSAKCFYITNRGMVFTSLKELCHYYQITRTIYEELRAKSRNFYEFMIQVEQLQYAVLSPDKRQKAKNVVPNKNKEQGTKLKEAYQKATLVYNNNPIMQDVLRKIREDEEEKEEEKKLPRRSSYKIRELPDIPNDKMDDSQFSL